MCVLKYVVNRIGPQNTIEDIKHLKIQHLIENPKKIQQLRPVPKKIQIFEIQNPQKYSVDPCLYICQVHPPWDFSAIFLSHESVNNFPLWYAYLNLNVWLSQN